MLARAFLIMLGVSLAGIATTAADETWPTRAIKVIVPVAAGGGVDTMARIMAEPLGQRLRQGVVVENMGGAGGVIATNTVAKAEPDGYTFLFDTPGQAAGPFVHKHLAYDPIKDFAAVSLVARFPLVLVINPKVPAQNLAEFVALLKANPGKYTFGSSGVGGSSHIPVELFKHLANVDIMHIPFRGNSESSAALIAGNVDMIIDGIAPQLGNIKEGRVRAIGVTTLERTPFLPDVPTIAELLPGYEYPMWVGVSAPAKAPRDIVDRLSSEIAAAVQAPVTKRRYSDINVEAVGSSPAQFDQFFRQQLAVNKDIITRAHIEPVD